MSFLKEETWNGQVYSGGWVTPEGGDAAVIEPATGRELGRIGIAAPDDVTRAVQLAAAAQPAWAALPHTERAAVLRRAASLWEANAAEIEDWVIRESGKVGPAAQFETHVSVNEIYEAATLPSRPYGDLLPSEQPRLSFAERVPVGDPASGQVALGPIIDERQLGKVHALVTASTDAGARLAAGGTYEGLFYNPTVLAEVTPDMPAWAQEVFGPVAPVIKFSTAEEAAALAAQTEYGLSLGILTRDVMRGLDLARKIPTGIVHINEQTVDDEPNVPFGGIFDSGTGTRFGGAANLEAFTETRWVTIRGDIAPYPF
jgi:acyl-CoA reductase-like NAD-dependent aldehyde dehydrogenase